jgi:hypothetical protein
MGPPGLEPGIALAGKADFKSAAYTNFATAPYLFLRHVFLLEKCPQTIVPAK